MTDEKKLEFIVKNLEKKGWGRLGKKEVIFNVPRKKGMLVLRITYKDQYGATCYLLPLPCVLIDLEARKLWFGEEKIKKVKPKKFYWYCKYDKCCDGYYTEKEFVKEFGKNTLVKFRKDDEWENDDGIEMFGRYWKRKILNQGHQWYSREMIDQGTPLKMLGYVYKFLKEQKK